MRSRDEVLTVDTINDRLRELEAQQAASEPVAWALRDSDGQYHRLFWTANAAHTEQQTSDHTPVPLYAHPSAAAVTITDAMVEAAAKALFLDDTISHGMTWDDASPRLVKEFKAYARIALTAALTAASEGASA